TASLESDTALKDWKALQPSPSISPSTWTQKIGLLLLAGRSLASSRDFSQSILPLRRSTFFSTMGAAIVGPTLPVVTFGVFLSARASAVNRKTSSKAASEVNHLMARSFLAARAVRARAGDSLLNCL